jgi:hypothetical protein
MGIPTLMAGGPSSGTFTAGPTTNRLGVYMYAGGGGAGPDPGCIGNRQGGYGGAGFYNKPITQPFSQPYSVGAGGNPNAGGPPGSSGGNTTMANVGTVNGGGGGPNQANVYASPGNQPGASLTISNQYRPGGSTGTPGATGSTAAGIGAVNPQVGGGSGFLVVFENSGT